MQAKNTDNENWASIIPLHPRCSRALPCGSSLSRAAWGFPCLCNCWWSRSSWSPMCIGWVNVEG